MKYYNILGAAIDFMIDMNISNEDIMGYILDIKVCLEASKNDSGIDVDKFAQLLYETGGVENMPLTSILLDRVVYSSNKEGIDEKIFC